MHEYSIVQSLIDLCEQNATNNNATKVTKVTVKVGKLSGVEPDLLSTAYETFRANTICEDAPLQMIVQDVIVECKECNTTSTLSTNEFCCPKCSSYELDIKDGEDMYLMSLEME